MIAGELVTMPTHQLRDKARLALVVTSFVTLDAEWESMARLRLTPHTRCAFGGFKRDLRPGRATPAVSRRESPARTAVRDAISATNPIWPVLPVTFMGSRTRRPARPSFSTFRMGQDARA